MLTSITIVLVVVTGFASDGSSCQTSDGKHTIMFFSSSGKCLYKSVI